LSRNNPDRLNSPENLTFNPGIAPLIIVVMLDLLR
jgi:hypothetical protein